MSASISLTSGSCSRRMKVVIDPGHVAVVVRHRPSTVRSRGVARASISTISRRHQRGSARISCVFAAPQKTQTERYGPDPSG